MGRAAYVHLVRLRKSPDLPLEVRKRVDALLEKWDASKAFPSRGPALTPGQAEQQEQSGPASATGSRHRASPPAAPRRT